MKRISIILGILIIVYICIINLISTSKIAFSFSSGMLGCFMIIYGYKGRDILDYIKSNKLLKLIYKVCRIVVICIVVMLFIIEIRIISYPKHNTSQCDYIMVLGAGLSNGNYPSVTLADRLDSAVEYMNNYGDISGKIVVSGGQGSDEKLSEAQAMKDYLVNKGIDEKKILMEDKSSTTSENFKFSKKVIEEDSGKDISDIAVKVITTSFHAFRSSILAEKNGYYSITNYSSKTMWYLVPVNYLRESFAVVKSVIFD